MATYLVVSALWLATLVAAFRVAQTTARTPEVAQRVHALHEQVRQWQVAHDHLVAELDRRMRRVEEAAARAETEARMVSSVLIGQEPSC